MCPFFRPFFFPLFIKNWDQRRQAEAMRVCADMLQFARERDLPKLYDFFVHLTHELTGRWLAAGNEEPRATPGERATAPGHSET